MIKHNFYAGPAILPAPVLEQAAASIKDFADMGLSILEISHRSKQFEAVMEEAQKLVKELMNLDEEYTVLFLSGGASSQFYMVPMNLLNDHEKACYVNTGVWSSGAIKEAKLFGTIETIATSEQEHFTHIPKNYKVPTDGVYLHITSNNTIYGTQYHWWPQTSIPLVCDMSSDILSRTLDFSKFALIYAGAQKNMGAAGVTVVVVRKSLLGRTNKKLPSMLDYRSHMDKGSMYNTPPVFPIYVTLLTLRWIKETGLQIIENRNKRKAESLYAEIDRNSCFYGTVNAEDRSLMNVVFRAHKTEHETRFLELCKEAGCVGLAGHRSVGGFRASLYNALQQESVDALIAVMQEFEKKYA